MYKFKELKYAIDTLEGIDEGEATPVHGFDKIYPFTTENIDGYIKYFDLKDKSLLTVGSSGDQVLNANLRGCKDITVYDLCPCAKYYFNLKKSAILSLNNNEFCDFLCSDAKLNKKVFNLKSFSKIKDTLREIDYDSYVFWKELFSVYNSKLIRKRLFTSDEDSLDTLRVTNSYLQDDNYKKLQESIVDVTPKFITGDICNAKELLTESYDNIFLSNIANYASIWDNEHPVEKLKEIFLDIYPHLNDDGKIQLAYLYQGIDGLKNNTDINDISNLRKVRDVFVGCNLNIAKFDGIRGIQNNDPKEKDTVLIYTKTRKK